MSTLRWVLAAAVTGALLVSIRAPGSGLETVRFSIALPIGTFEKDHAVPLRLTLTNVSLRPVHVNGRFAVNDDREPAAFREVAVAVRTPSGRRAAFRLDIKIRAAQASDVVAVAPKGSVSKTVDVARYYVLDERGAYEIRATYATAAPGALPGPILSNTIRFTVR